ncbi:NDP-sugar epimerase, includes UDP-GlcNAc-inverting 4,6-dehydratase FlaA1 and capsular polysaccharide biosynthesis protein EpsC [Clostridium cavendishii DSM 21758]|uniref:NDP-sugar epimerase, includes UDP-GlcNAc-inverting 4,6-dehydratase FlaA1 and capsular polysaccharide biosynthesis protein EpsC n=1 Tax=Clostridium cavendishii DSM 21758 TaxID=1121302 RepID=A0A1M6QEC5_9CLOT|nr:nucleoside-diphosphate sugar epimerase/dehydratase [Clostridium cavendishii]SHK18528.1 NDP-sugar epimerase, includes UDP-GlcNAc-inverting 4,6-dehydratase FlaA1 and capsular polysaccharide biosynthesis protein EpsC [Clostridium cavendishii DSM 21758]
MNRKYFKVLHVIIDIGIILFSYLIAFSLRFESNVIQQYFGLVKEQLPIVILIYLISFYLFRLYESLWTFASIEEVLLGVAGCISGTIVSLIFSLLLPIRIPIQVTIIAGMLNILFIVGYRMSFRIYGRLNINLSMKNSKDGKKVLIVGAGWGGDMVLREIKRHPELNYNPVGFIDDSTYKIGSTFSGIRVLGNRYNIEEIVKGLGIEIIIIAIPTLEGESKKELIKLCNNTKVKVKLMPGVYELMDNKVNLNKMRDVDLKDLLGREEVKLEHNGISEYLTNKVVLVTGGGGSIGSELCRQIARFNPKELLILDIYENNAYDIQNELLRKYPELNQKVFIASVRDRRRLEQIFKDYKPEVVFHAAAHKHVPLMEFNPTEAIKNNVFGTLNVAECANSFGVNRFVLISTDKAVNPTNIMGATKRICEMIIQAIDKISKTEYVAVRFGNVLGSNGSVIPLFKKQIAEGGPVTLTHKNITRYFMLIPEAAQLVLQAGAYAKGGEIFVLDMGKPVKIYDLAKDLIRLSGYEPNVDMKIEVTGLRPGEKLYEELLMAEEGLQNTVHEKIFIGRPMVINFKELKENFEQLQEFVEKEDAKGIVEKVEEIVPTYKKNELEEIAATK